MCEKPEYYRSENTLNQIQEYRYPGNGVKHFANVRITLGAAPSARPNVTGLTRLGQPCLGIGIQAAELAGLGQKAGLPDHDHVSGSGHRCLHASDRQASHALPGVARAPEEGGTGVKALEDLAQMGWAMKIADMLAV